MDSASKLRLNRATY